jgi:integrase
MANGRSCLAGVERVSIPADGAVFQSIVRSIGKAIHARSNARTVFNQEVLPIHFESAHFVTMGRGSCGRSEKALKVEQWLKELKHSPKTKSNIKGLLHRIFEYAMKWEILETQRNPMQLVEIKGVTKRVRKKVVLTVEQYQALLAELPYHIQVMVMIAMCLGLRVSEIRALQWPDFDLKGRILTLTRSIVGRYVWNGGKTGASEDEVFLDSKLVSVLEDWRKQCVETPEAWLFANADTKRPVHGDAIQKDYLRPAGEKIRLQGVGWHSFRHTYRTLIDDIGTPLGVQERLMRHADIKTT